MKRIALLCALASCIFAITACNNDETDPGRITFSLLEPTVINKTYSSITYSIPQLSNPDFEIEDVYVAISDDADLDVNDFPDRALRFKDFDFTKIPFNGNEVVFKGTDLTPNTEYSFIFYHTTGNDTLVRTRNNYTAALDRFGFEPRVIESGGELNLIDLKIDEDNLDKIAFYLGEESLEIISSEQDPETVTSNRSFTVQIPEFDSYDSLKLTAQFDGQELEGHYVEYSWNGTEIAPFYQSRYQYVIPSDWKYLKTLSRELSEDRVAFFENSTYVEFKGKVYFYGHGSVTSVTKGLYAYDLSTLEHELILSDNLPYQTLVVENDELIRYRFAESTIVKERIDVEAKTYELIDEDVLEGVNTYRSFFHQGYFFEYNSTVPKKYNLATGEQTEINNLSDYTTVLAPRRDLFQTKSYLVSQDINEANSWDLRIYNVANDTWISTQFPTDAKANFTVFEYEGILGMGHVNKELYFFFPNTGEWKRLSDFVLSHHSGNDFIQTVPFYVPSLDQTIFLAGRAIYQFEPIGIDLINVF